MATIPPGLKSATVLTPMQLNAVRLPHRESTRPA